jgi:hypothetical protein
MGGSKGGVKTYEPSLYLQSNMVQYMYRIEVRLLRYYARCLCLVLWPLQQHSSFYCSKVNVLVGVMSSYIRAYVIRSFKPIYAPVSTVEDGLQW